MIIGTGVDIVNIPRMKQAIHRWKGTFKNRVFTPVERNYCKKKQHRPEHYAARFAVKEAVLKALGSGLVKKMTWCDVEVMNDQNGKPDVVLWGEVKRIAKKK